MVDPRSTWTTVPNKADVRPRPLTHYRGVGVHWPALAGALRLEDQPHGACCALLRTLEAGQAARGYANLAYQSVACPHGRLIVGRGAERVNAANSGQANLTHGSVLALIGMDDTPTDALLSALLSAPAYLWADDALVPHSQFKATACPGPRLTLWLAAGAPAPDSEDDDMEPADVWKVPVGHPVTAAPTTFGRVATSTLRRAIQAEAAALACLELLKAGTGGTVTQAMIDDAVAAQFQRLAADLADGDET